MSVQEIVARQMLRDIVQCNNFQETEKRLGLIPPSADVADREHQESHERLSHTYLVANDICASADIAAEVLLRLSALDWPVPPGPRDFEHTQALSRAACMVVITHLVSRHVLVVQEEKR